jgi:chemotaxis protein methyltransferase CheR
MSSIYAGFKSQNYEGAIAYRKVAIPSEVIPPTEYIPASPPSYALPENTYIPPAPQPSAIECYDIAKQHADRNEWDKATDWLEQALRQDPTLTQAQFLLGLLHMQFEAYDDAVRVLKKTVYLDRRFVLAHFNLGVAYWNLGDVQAACRAWENAYDLTDQYQPDEVLPFGDDMTASYLASVIKKYIQSSL